MTEAHGDDLEPRVSALEREMAQVRGEAAQARSDAAAARVLSTGADRDVSEVRAELRAHTSAISALRQTQVDFDRRLRSLERTTHSGFAEMRTGFAELRAEMGDLRDGLRSEMGEMRAELHSEIRDIRGGFATMQTGMQAIVDLLRNDGSGR